MLKSRCLLGVWEARGWSAVCLSDVWFAEKGVYTFASNAQTWTVVVEGRVAIALNEPWAAAWRAGRAAAGERTRQREGSNDVDPPP